MITIALHGRSEFSSERREAAVKAVHLAPDDPGALNDLAWEYHLAGTPRPGLPLAQKAARLVPWSPSILDTWAALLAAAGKCDDAVLVQQRAVDMLREGVSAERRAHYEDALARYQGGCAPHDGARSGGLER
jgi:Flp pilus assembly protein TadD